MLLVELGDLTNDEWLQLALFLPKAGCRGGRWVDHRMVINGILFRVGTGVRGGTCRTGSGAGKACTSARRHLGENPPGRPGRGRLPGGGTDWSRVSVDSTSCRAHRHAAGAPHRTPRIAKRRSTPRQRRTDEGLGRPRGGLTSKIHLVRGRRPSSARHADHAGPVGRRPAIDPDPGTHRGQAPGWRSPAHPADHLGGDKAYSSRRNRRYLRRRQIKHTIPEPKHQRANCRRRSSRLLRIGGTGEPRERGVTEVSCELVRFRRAFLGLGGHHGVLKILLVIWVRVNARKPRVPPLRRRPRPGRAGVASCRRPGRRESALLCDVLAPDLFETVLAVRRAEAELFAMVTDVDVVEAVRRRY